MASMTSGWQILLLKSKVSLTLASPMYLLRRMVKSGRFRPTTHHCYLRQRQAQVIACVVKLRMRNTSIHYSQHAKMYWRPTWRLDDSNFDIAINIAARWTVDWLSCRIPSSAGVFFFYSLCHMCPIVTNKAEIIRSSFLQMILSNVIKCSVCSFLAI